MIGEELMDVAAALSVIIICIMAICLFNFIRKEPDDRIHHRLYNISDLRSRVPNRSDLNLDEIRPTILDSE